MVSLLVNNSLLSGIGNGAKLVVCRVGEISQDLTQISNVYTIVQNGIDYYKYCTGKETLVLLNENITRTFRLLDIMSMPESIESLMNAQGKPWILVAGKVTNVFTGCIDTILYLEELKLFSLSDFTFKIGSYSVGKVAQVAFPAIVSAGSIVSSTIDCYDAASRYRASRDPLKKNQALLDLTSSVIDIGKNVVFIALSTHVVTYLVFSTLNAGVGIACFLHEQHVKDCQKPIKVG